MVVLFWYCYSFVLVGIAVRIVQSQIRVVPRWRRFHSLFLALHLGPGRFRLWSGTDIVVVVVVVVRDVVFRSALLLLGRRRLSRRFSEGRRLAIVEPLGEDIDRFVEVVDGHLIGGSAQPTIQAPDAHAEVHLGLDDVLVGAEGALEALGQGQAFLGLDRSLFRTTTHCVKLYEVNKQFSN